MSAITEQAVKPEDRSGNRDDNWGLLGLFFGYRLLVALLLVSLFFSHWGPAFLGQRHPELFTLTSASYLGFVIASGLLLYWRSPRGVNQASMMILVDIVCVTLMLHASGGIQTGLGTLLAVSIASGSLLIPGSRALLYAALATLAILTEQTFAHFVYADAGVSYPHAGLLGASFFAIATLAHVLSLRLSRSEQLVSQQELDLANMAQLNEYVIQHMQTGILVVDSEEKIHLINEAAWYLLGMPDAKVGNPLEQACQALSRRMNDWRKNPQREQETFRPTPSGRELKAGFSPLGRTGSGGIVIFVEDAASFTQQAQQIKLASLGRLTASIAHEIRNPLGAIGHAGQLLQEAPDIPESDMRLIEIIGSNTRRVNEIIENVLQLSRRKPPRPREFIILPWLESFLAEFRESRNLPQNALSLRIDPPNTQIFADSNQLRQILTNLCENAVCHFNRDGDELRILINGGITRASGGPFIELMDNGPGIPPEITRQIFEPFFTTGSGGTGLGLYIAKELSESNRIRLEYFPVATGGSCFRMSFPGVRFRGDRD